MVLRTWIVPEPNPNLSLTINKIDYRKFDYEDLRWIYSSAMKKYYEEFCKLQGFSEYAERLFHIELERRESIIKQQRTPHHIRTPPIEPPPTVRTPPLTKVLKTPPVLPRRKKAFLKSNKLTDYESTINKYIVSGSNSSTKYEHSETCSVS